MKKIIGWVMKSNIRCSAMKHPYSFKRHSCRDQLRCH
jgi:hypothetical protein